MVSSFVCASLKDKMGDSTAKIYLDKNGNKIVRASRGTTGGRTGNADRRTPSRRTVSPSGDFTNVYAIGRAPSAQTGGGRGGVGGSGSGSNTGNSEKRYRHSDSEKKYYYDGNVVTQEEYYLRMDVETLNYGVQISENALTAGRKAQNDYITKTQKDMITAQREYDSALKSKTKANTRFGTYAEDWETLQGKQTALEIDYRAKKTEYTKLIETVPSSDTKYKVEFESSTRKVNELEKSYKLNEDSYYGMKEMKDIGRDIDADALNAQKKRMEASKTSYTEALEDKEALKTDYARSKELERNFEKMEDRISGLDGRLLIDSVNVNRAAAILDAEDQILKDKEKALEEAKKKMETLEADAKKKGEEEMDKTIEFQVALANEDQIGNYVPSERQITAKKVMDETYVPNERLKTIKTGDGSELSTFYDSDEDVYAVIDGKNIAPASDEFVEYLRNPKLNGKVFVNTNFENAKENKGKLSLIPETDIEDGQTVTLNGNSYEVRELKDEYKGQGDAPSGTSLNNGRGGRGRTSSRNSGRKNGVDKERTYVVEKASVTNAYPTYADNYDDGHVVKRIFYNEDGDVTGYDFDSVDVNYALNNKDGVDKGPSKKEENKGPARIAQNKHSYDKFFAGVDMADTFSQVSTLFGYDNSEWKSSVDRLFHNAILGGSDYWTEQICYRESELDDVENSIMNLNSDGMLTTTSTITATRRTVYTNNGTRYLYQVSFFVRNPEMQQKDSPFKGSRGGSSSRGSSAGLDRDERQVWNSIKKASSSITNERARYSNTATGNDVHFNIRLEKSGGDKYIFDELQEVDPGDEISYTSVDSLAAYSDYKYNRICIEFYNDKPLDMFFEEVDEICTTVQSMDDAITSNIIDNSIDNDDDDDSLFDTEW